MAPQGVLLQQAPNGNRSSKTSTIGAPFGAILRDTQPLDLVQTN